MRTTISKLFQVLKQKVCKHEFDLKDLELTGIPEIEKPSSNDYEEWVIAYSRRMDGCWRYLTNGVFTIC